MTPTPLHLEVQGPHNIAEFEAVAPRRKYSVYVVLREEKKKGEVKETKSTESEGKVPYQEIGIQHAKR